MCMLGYVIVFCIWGGCCSKKMIFQVVELMMGK